MLFYNDNNEQNIYAANILALKTLSSGYIAKRYILSESEKTLPIHMHNINKYSNWPVNLVAKNMNILNILTS